MQQAAAAMAAANVSCFMDKTEMRMAVSPNRHSVLQCFHGPEPGGNSQWPDWLNMSSRMSLTDCSNRPWSALVTFAHPCGGVSGTISTIVLVIAFTIKTSPFIFTYL